MYGNSNNSPYHQNGGGAASPYNGSASPSTPSSSPRTTTASPSATSLSQRIKNYDYQNNIPSEFRVYTTHGAILSFTTILLLFSLTLTEYNYNLTRTTRETVYVNTTTHQRIDMEIDITFPDVQCPLLSFDAFDPNNQQQSMHLDSKHRVWKHRIGRDGHMIGRRSKFEHGKTLQHEDHVQEYANSKVMAFTNDLKNEADDEEELCGSCYGAEENGECCNTCDDVKRAYQVKGWQFTPNMDVKQCRESINSNHMVGEGCNIHGLVSLSSGGGNVHITPGHELGEVENVEKIVLLLSQ
jgi:hypothetical protein